MSMSKDFVQHTRSMVGRWLKEAKAAKKREKEAVTPKTRGLPGARSLGGGRRGLGSGNGAGGGWGSPAGSNHAIMAPQVKHPKYSY